jgi:hypothetical protein
MKIRPGGWAWFGLAAGVAAVDFVLIETDHETMSEVFGDALKHPVHRWPVILVWAGLTLHLFGNLLPSWLRPLKKLDPISNLARALTPSA